MEQQMSGRAVEDRRMREILAEYLPRMDAIVESRYIAINDPPSGGAGRSLKRCVAVLVWEEPDGTERTEVVGERGNTPLHLKGLLHDGIYLLAHEGEEGFTPR